MKRMQNQMVSRAVAVLESISDIGDWTTHGETRKALIAAVQNDFIARVSINNVYELADLDEGRVKTAFAALLDVVKAKSPVLHETYSELQVLAKKVGAASVDVLNYLEEARLRAIAAHHEAKERMRIDRQHTRLPDWVGPC